MTSSIGCFFVVEEDPPHPTSFWYVQSHSSCVEYLGLEADWFGCKRLLLSKCAISFCAFLREVLNLAWLAAPDLKMGGNQSCFPVTTTSFRSYRQVLLLTRLCKSRWVPLQVCWVNVQDMLNTWIRLIGNDFVYSTLIWYGKSCCSIILWSNWWNISSEFIYRVDKENH